MAKYRGGSRAQTNVMASGGAAFEMTTTASEFARMYASNAAEIRANYSRYRQVAMKRLERIEKSGRGKEVLEQYKGKFKTLNEITNAREMQAAIVRLHGFLYSGQSTTLSGINKRNKDFVEAMRGHGVNLSKKEVTNFQIYMGAVQKVFGKELYKLLDSDQVALMYNVFKKGGKLDKKVFADIIKELSASKKKRKGKLKSSFSRKQRKKIKESEKQWTTSKQGQSVFKGKGWARIASQNAKVKKETAKKAIRKDVKKSKKRRIVTTSKKLKKLKK